MADNKETEPDDMMNVEDMDWFKEQAAKDTRQNSSILSQTERNDTS